MTTEQQEQPQQQVPQALMEEVIEPSAVAVMSSAGVVLLRAFVGQVDNARFVASRTFSMAPEQAIKLGQDLAAAGNAVKQAESKIQAVTLDQAPPNLRG